MQLREKEMIPFVTLVHCMEKIPQAEKQIDLRYKVPSDVLVGKRYG